MSLGQDGPPTRTRMPEGHGGHPGGSGGGRRSQPRRALVTVVSIIVLLIAALAFANRGQHRTDGGGTDTGTGTTAGTSSSADSGSAKDGAGTSTAPSGGKPATGKADGIPAGYTHDAPGAQSAAANYAVALGSADMFNTDRRHQIVAAIHDPSVTAKLQGSLDQAYSGEALKRLGLQPDGTAPAGLTFVSRTVPVGTKVTTNAADTMTVQVWCTDLIGLAGTGSTKPVTSDWFTVTEKLVWLSGDWKIQSSSQTAGPAPVSSDGQAATADEIAGAVRDFGGFTYAR
jgi:hypothetical protein